MIIDENKRYYKADYNYRRHCRCLAISCIIKLFNLQIVNGEEYRIQADNRTIRTYATKAPRGEILTGMGFRLLKIGADTAFRYLKLIFLQRS